MRPFDFCYKITAALQYCVILESLLTHSSEKDTETENETSYVIIESSTINNLKTRGEYFFSWQRAWTNKQFAGVKMS